MLKSHMWRLISLEIVMPSSLAGNACVPTGYSSAQALHPSHQFQVSAERVSMQKVAYLWPLTLLVCLQHKGRKAEGSRARPCRTTALTSSSTKPPGGDRTCICQKNKKKKSFLAGGLQPFLNNIIPVAKRPFCWIKPQLQRGFAHSATSIRGDWRIRFAGPQGKGFGLVLEDYYAADIPTAIPRHNE